MRAILIGDSAFAFFVTGLLRCSPILRSSATVNQLVAGIFHCSLDWSLYFAGVVVNLHISTYMYNTLPIIEEAPRSKK